MPESVVEPVVTDIDHARAGEYSLLSTLLLRAPDAGLLARLAKLRGDATPIGNAHAALAEAAAHFTAQEISREYFDLFVGVGRGELLPYASFYLTGSLNAQPLARLRETLRSLGIERAEGFSEPEDHVGVLFAIMAGLACGDIAADKRVDWEFFRDHLESWIERFFQDLEGAKSARFYAHVGALGTVFMKIEARAFSLPA
jgi:TorA maturation chaperone TorD